MDIMRAQELVDGLPTTELRYDGLPTVEVRYSGLPQAEKFLGSHFRSTSTIPRIKPQHYSKGYTTS